MSEIDKILTQATLLEIKHIDYNNFLEREEHKLDTLQLLLKHNMDDKNVQSVVKLKTEEFRRLQDFMYDFMTEVGIHKHRDTRMVILIEEIK